MDSQFLTSLETRMENRRSFYGRFQLGPFNCGQGLTVANAFRRTLLSECSGLGIIVVELEGACHEYSTLPGIQESVLEILLNLKQIILTTCPLDSENTKCLDRRSNLKTQQKLNRGRRPTNRRLIVEQFYWSRSLKSVNITKTKSFDHEVATNEVPINNVLFSKDPQNEQDKFMGHYVAKESEGPQINSHKKNEIHIVGSSEQPNQNTNVETTWAKIGYINVQGPKIVRARDIKLPEPIRCVDPNQYLATLAYDGKLNIKLLICKGKKSIVESLLPIHFNQNWLFHYNWFSKQRIAPNPITLFLLRNQGPPAFIDSHKNKQINIQLKTENKLIRDRRPTNRQLFLGWQQRKKYSSKKIIKNQRFIGSEGSSSEGDRHKQNTVFKTNQTSADSAIWPFGMGHSVAPKTKNFENKTHMDCRSPIIGLEETLVESKIEDPVKISIYGSSTPNQKIKSKNIKKPSFQSKIGYKPHLIENFTQSKNTSNSRPLIVDSVFLPVQKANYNVELDETFDISKERIILEIWTNGSMHPRQAISLAAKRLVRLFYPFINN